MMLSACIKRTQVVLVYQHYLQTSSVLFDVEFFEH